MHRFFLNPQFDVLNPQFDVLNHLLFVKSIDFEL